MNCPTCGEPMTGVVLVDGWMPGREIHEARAFCRICQPTPQPTPTGALLRGERIKRMISLKDLSLETGITVPEMSGAESGRASNDELAAWLLTVVQGQVTA